MKPIACGSKESDLPLSRFPLRGQAGGTAASAALRLGHSTGPKQNAHPRSGPVRKRCSVVGGLCFQTPALPGVAGIMNFMLQTGHFTC